MIKFFLDNEAAINFVCFSVFLGSLLVPNVFNKTIQGFLGLVFSIAFSICFLSVLLNGIYKGF
jgi:hypothetical protein